MTQNQSRLELIVVGPAELGIAAVIAKLDQPMAECEKEIQSK
jgi:hypothetical protein